jgi:hypothetical protein
LIESDGQGIVLMSKDRASSRGSLGGKVDVQNLDTNAKLRMVSNKTQEFLLRTIEQQDF